MAEKCEYRNEWSEVEKKREGISGGTWKVGRDACRGANVGGNEARQTDRSTDRRGDVMSGRWWLECG